ncbi:hypothetical protein SAY87_028300 [Trapa incisa]|uniref:Transcriptional corepressor SEUSS n=1 Tax=Trapa incisa TaxID=236973 RepID=A0AAN7QPS4_9MYRT|nr:hypothetical protein SAY87_028300 [Trapa incisa]
MVLSGPPTPISGSQNVSPSLLQSNSGMSEGVTAPSQTSFPSLLYSHPQMGNMNVLGNMQNMSSILSQSFGCNSQNPAFSGSMSGQRGSMDEETGTELDSLANVGNAMSYNSPSSSFLLGNPSTCGQFHGQHFQNSSNQMVPDQSPSQQNEQKNFPSTQQAAQQFSVPPKAQIGGLSSLDLVKLEPQMITEQLRSTKNMNAMKLEPQQIPTLSMRNLPPVKMDPQLHPESQLFLQQQQQLMQLKRMSSSPTQLNLLQQQRIFHLQQQHQQQQLMKVLPQQRIQLPQHFQQQNLTIRPPPVKSGYEPGTCARRISHFINQQQQRPKDNNIEFWRKFVDEYFARNAKKKWCVSMYGSGRQTTGVFPQDVWHCDICNRKPGRGFEATYEVFPRLFKIKYEGGTVEELLYLDMPRESQNSSGQIVLDYAKAIQESVFDQLRVVREGQLRVIFTPELKICSWEFCARRHDELIPRRLLIPQVSQLGAVAQKYQAATQNASPTVSELQNSCNMFLSSARQLAKAVEVPSVNDLGYTKRYVRCLQISEVVNCMKDLIDYSRETGTGPMESLAKYPRRAATSVGPRQGQLTHEQLQHQRQLLVASPDLNGGHQSSSQSASTQIPSMSNGGSGNNSLNPVTNCGSSSNAMGALHHQNSVNSRQHNTISNTTSPYNGIVQNQSPGSSCSIPPTHSGNTNSNPLQTSQSALSATTHVGSTNCLPNTTMQQAESVLNSMAQSSVQKILQNMISSPLQSAGSMGSDMKSRNGSLPAGLSPTPGLGNANGFLGRGGYDPNGGAGPGQSAMMINGLRAAMSNSSLVNGRVGMSSMISDRAMNHLHQQDIGNLAMNGLGPMNGAGFGNNIQYEWKSP